MVPIFLFVLRTVQRFSAIIGLLEAGFWLG
jgi:hypothetical protein